MFGRNIRFFTARSLLVLAILAAGACAKPKYETVINSVGGEKIEKVSDCQTRLAPSGNCVLWAWEKLPNTKEAGILALKIVRANGLDDSPVPLELATPPAVVLWMPEMGHGSVPVKVERIDQGSYRVTNVFFIMPGTWEIRIQVKTETEAQDEATLLFTL